MGQGRSKGGKKTSNKGSASTKSISISRQARGQSQASRSSIPSPLKSTFNVKLSEVPGLSQGGKNSSKVFSSASGLVRDSPPHSQASASCSSTNLPAPRFNFTFKSTKPAATKVDEASIALSNFEVNESQTGGDDPSLAGDNSDVDTVSTAHSQSEAKTKRVKFDYFNFLDVRGY